MLDAGLVTPECPGSLQPPAIGSGQRSASSRRAKNEKPLAMHPGHVYLPQKVQVASTPSPPFPSSSEREGFRSPEPGIMTRSARFQRPVSLLAGAVLALLASALLAPPAVEGGCSHLVTSRTSPGQLATRIEPLLGDVSDRTDPLPGPLPRPCSGAWCSGQPAAPAVPAGVSQSRTDSWAWCQPIADPTSGDPSFLRAATTRLRPRYQGTAVFHPPRPFLLSLST